MDGVEQGGALGAPMAMNSASVAAIAPTGTSVMVDTNSLAGEAMPNNDAATSNGQADARHADR
ncbi:MAG: hypothetical protein R2755_13305 [Acidimicrobiales bacterium]